MTKSEVLSVLEAYKSDFDFYFIEESHTYVRDGEELIPVTTFISQFKEDFDSDRWSLHIAERDGKTQEQVLQEWKKKADISTEMGSETHRMIEEFFTGDVMLSSNQEAVDRYNKFLRWWNEGKQPEVIGCEVQIHAGKLAGTIDMLCLYNEKIYIVDWKTNEKFTQFSIYKKKLLKPFAHLSDCHLNIYSLQLSAYKAMLKEIGIDVSGMIIVYLPPEGEAKRFYAKDVSGYINL